MQHLHGIERGGDLVAHLSQRELRVARLLGDRARVLFAAPLGVNGLERWHLERLAAAAGTFAPDRVLVAVTADAGSDDAETLRDALRLAAIQAGATPVEIPDPLPLASALASSPGPAPSDGRPPRWVLRLRRFLRRRRARTSSRQL